VDVDGSSLSHCLGLRVGEQLALSRHSSNKYVHLRDGRISTHADPTSTSCATSRTQHL